ncbi:hypothetical protein [Pseudoalteromonas sp. SR43-5]|uniref:hypothetical protein n=1 Tax=Pseudoalteromonas sp. SR43-5 TaxID=2760941 RepID=UPI0015F9DD3B|nr:hypothetical protein [Pseudoalteromonas sp. SR43-5]MBB1307754.1 hypothetical protein [Pseudoalteromonas sp. SR43-5]
MKHFIVFVVVALLSHSLIAGEYAQEANENPFLNGELNSKYEGEVTALAGDVVEIQPTEQNFPVYKLNLSIVGVKPIWVTSIAPKPEGGISVGDKMIFKGFISTTLATDPSGKLGKITGSKTLLMAIQSERAK